MKSTRYILLSLITLLTGCVREELFDTSNDDGLLRVPVTLQLEIATIEEGTPGTKSIMEPDYMDPDSPTYTDDQISNIVILQFNGTTSSAPLVGGQKYIGHWPLHPNPLDPEYDADDVVMLVASPTPNTVVVLANTNTTEAQSIISSGSTLGSFLESAENYSVLATSAGIFMNDGGNQFLRMSGSAVIDEIGPGTDISVTLKRNAAKIIINVKNNTSGNTGDDLVSLSKVHLKQVNGKYYYLTNVASGVTDEGGEPLQLSDSYSPAFPNRIDYDSEVFPSSNNPSGASDGEYVTYTYYIPTNLRGTTASTVQYNKGINAPEGSTFFRLYGTYGASQTPIEYTYYLGENLTNNFNILPNHKYTYNIVINAKGDERIDHRITDYKEVIFDTDANCYMVHPPAVEGQSRIYAFPVRRAAVFWNEEGTNDGVYGASAFSGYTDCAVTGSTSWEAVVLWSDFNLSGYTGDRSFLVSGFDSGTGYDPKAHSQPYIKIRVSTGMKGNVVVGMRVGGKILWSWHLWITDYDPDQNMAPVSGKYIYAVPNGEIHRYNSPIWTTEPTESAVGYAKGFIMDRNLGASGTTFDCDGSRGCYYQFGRKDPFLDRSQDNEELYFYLGGTAPSEKVFNYGANNPAKRSIPCSYNSADDSKNVRYTVNNPLVYIYAGPSRSGWTTIYDDLGDGGINTVCWNDPKYNLHHGDQEKLELKKSIYDPCPPGWKVPVSSIWKDFVRENASNSEAKTYTVAWSDTGLNYYPEGYRNANTTGRIFYPGLGYLYENNGNRIYYENSGALWSSSRNTGRIGYYCMFRINELNAGSSYDETLGFNVRCVRE